MPFTPIAGPVVKSTTGFTPLSALASSPAASPIAPKQGFISSVISGVKNTASDMWGSLTAPGPKQDFFSDTAATDAFHSLSSTIQDAGNRLYNAVSTVASGHATALQQGVAVGEAGIGALNALFSPITSMATYAGHLPGIGSVATGINNVFSALSTGGADAASAAIDVLPVSQETKATIKPLAEELGGLAAQLIAGKVGGDVFNKFASKSKVIVDAVAKDPLVQSHDASGFTPLDTLTEPKPALSSPTALPGALTPLDTPDIIAARAQADAIPKTDLINTPERAALRSKVVDDAYGQGAAVQGKRLDIVSGPPASGKSSNLVEPLAKEHGALVTDSDEIKKMLPEYDNGMGAMATHDESAKLNFEVMKKAFANGDNVVFPTVGADAESLNRLIDVAHSAGYDIHLHNVDLSPELTAQRAATRFAETGRFVDPNYILNTVGSRSTESHGIVKTNEKLASHQQYDANVPKGGRYVVVERGAFGNPWESSSDAGMERSVPSGKDVGGTPRRSLATITSELEDARTHLSILKDTMADHPGRNLGNLVKNSHRSQGNEFVKGGDDAFQDRVGQAASGGGDINKLMEYRDAYAALAEQHTEALQNIKDLVAERNAARANPAPEPTGPLKTAPGQSRIGKSIEQKAIDAKLTDAFDKTAGYDPRIVKDQIARTSDLVANHFEDARAILRGDKPLPARMSPVMLVRAMEEYLKTNPDGEVAYELANSPLVSGTSINASEMRLMQEREPDSITAKFQELRAAREAALEKKGGLSKNVKKVVDEIQKEIKKTSSKRPAWEDFIREVQCGY